MGACYTNKSLALASWKTEIIRIQDMHLTVSSIREAIIMVNLKDRIEKKLYKCAQLVKILESLDI